MKKIALPLLLILLLLCGCGSETVYNLPGVQPVYYLTNLNGAWHLAHEGHDFSSFESIDEKISAVIDSMKKPTNESYQPIIGAGISLSDVQMYGNTAMVTLSEEYSLLAPAEKGLTDAGIAMSLFGIAGLDYVRISAEGSDMGVFLSVHSIVMDDETLRLNTFEITLFRVDRENGALKESKRKISVSDANINEGIVLGQLFSGEDYAVLPFGGDARLRSVSYDQEQGILAVDLMFTASSGPREVLDMQAVINTLAANFDYGKIAVTLLGEKPSAIGIEGFDEPVTVHE